MQWTTTSEFFENWYAEHTSFKFYLNNKNNKVKCADCNGQGVVSPPVEMLTYETPLYDQVLGRSHVNNTYQYGNKKFNERELSSNGLNKSKENTVYNNMFYKLTCAKCKGNKVVS